MKHGFGFCGSRKRPLTRLRKKMAMATLRWMGAPESEVKLVEAMYENTTGVVGSGMSKEFHVNIGLRQGSALSPLLFIIL